MKKQNRLRTPITYYGGKQQLLPVILNGIPKHKLYCEPFCGGAAVFFGKPASEVEVINDTNKELINFYKVCRNRFHDLTSLTRTTLHSREQHDDAWVIYNKPHLHDEVRRAWAVWVLSCQSFSSKLNGSWGFDKTVATSNIKINNKRDQFTEELSLRLQNAQIECSDALYIIKSRDTSNTFYYCDPPYFNSDMGHYDGYSEQDFENLLILLSAIKGKFMLSSYPSPLLQKYIKQQGWYMWSKEMSLSTGLKKRGYVKRKIEVITTNYKVKM